MILIVDDDMSIRSSLTFLLKRAGMEPMAVATPKEAIAVVRSTAPELILMDMNYSLTTSGDEGLCLLKQVKVFVPQVPVILMTAWGSISLAVEGMRAGAFDFITKPWNNILLLNTIRTAIELSHGGVPSADMASGRQSTPSAHGTASSPEPSNPAFSKIIGTSRVIRDIMEVVTRVAKTSASVLITGESGTGKELIAEAIHYSSLRSSQPFVKVNLGGISQSLFESEMFGHKKGAFTDAYTDRTGRFELADHGTIFLDEIGDLDPSCQVKLLRVLQDQTFEVLGDSRQRKVDVRVVSATNRDLTQMVADHTFREDLFYRINLIPIRIPPLRERREDIPLLAQYFARQSANAMPSACGPQTTSAASGRTTSVSSPVVPPDIAPDALEYLQSLPFTGNVRELKNLVERTLIVSGKPLLHREDFQMQYTALHPSGENNTTRGGNTLEDLEHDHIMEILTKNEGNVARTARELGISRAALYRRLDKYREDGQ